MDWFLRGYYLVRLKKPTVWWRNCYHDKRVSLYEKRHKTLSDLPVKITPLSDKKRDYYREYGLENAQFLLSCRFGFIPIIEDIFLQFESDDDFGDFDYKRITKDGLIQNKNKEI